MAPLFRSALIALFSLVFATGAFAQLQQGVRQISPGLSSSIPSDAPGYDIILIAGQSNAAGRGVYDAQIDGIASGRIFQFGGFAGGSYFQQIISGADPLQFPEAIETGIVGPGTAFARAYAESISPNRRVLLVPVAWGNTSLATSAVQSNAACGTTPCWSPTAPGLLYTNAITQANAAVTAAKAQFPASRVVGTLWVQGEADNNTAQATYAAAEDALIAGFRANITGAQSMWFVVGSMLPEYMAGVGSNVNAAHVDTPRRVALTAFAPGPGPGFGLSDNTHYSAAGQRLAGLSLFNAVAAAKANTVAGSAPAPVALPGQATALTIGTVVGSVIPFSWTAPATGGPVLKYIVQYKQSANSTWIIAGSTNATSFSVAAPLFQTAYDVRVLAYNASGLGTPSAPATATTGTYVSISPNLSSGSYIFSHEYAGGTTQDYKGGTSLALSGSPSILGGQINGKSALVMASATSDYVTVTGGAIGTVGGGTAGTTTCIIGAKLTAAVPAAGFYPLTGGANAGVNGGVPLADIVSQTAYNARARNTAATATQAAAITLPAPANGQTFVFATRWINDGTNITVAASLNGGNWISGSGTTVAANSVPSAFTRFDYNTAFGTNGAFAPGDISIAYGSCVKGVAASDETAIINAYKSALGVP